MEGNALEVVVIALFVLQLAIIGWLGIQYDNVIYMANRDIPTDLYNRRYTMQRLPLILQRAKRGNRPVTILMIDANDLKWVNDTYGHLAGDEGIRQLIRVLRTCSGPDAVIGRLGGDEFVAIYPGCDLSDGEIIVQSIHHALALPSPGLKWGLTVSIGIAVYPRDGEDSTRLLKVADERMYREKEHYHVHCPRKADPNNSGSDKRSDCRHFTIP
ncbi:GGDEF domain-containing protein [Alicyclobacillus curvatus]|nr:GGDEF domain-containing protein [Alicyclobacillus curvatus]